MVIGPGVSSSLNANCKRQLSYTKFDLNLVSLPHRERDVWLYKEATFRLY